MNALKFYNELVKDKVDSFYRYPGEIKDAFSVVKLSHPDAIEQIRKLVIDGQVAKAATDDRHIEPSAWVVEADDEIADEHAPWEKDTDAEGIFKRVTPKGRAWELRPFIDDNHDPFGDDFEANVRKAVKHIMARYKDGWYKSGGYVK